MMSNQKDGAWYRFSQHENTDIGDFHACHNSTIIIWQSAPIFPALLFITSTFSLIDIFTLHLCIVLTGAVSHHCDCPRLHLHIGPHVNWQVGQLQPGFNQKIIVFNIICVRILWWTLKRFQLGQLIRLWLWSRTSITEGMWTLQHSAQCTVRKCKILIGVEWIQFLIEQCSSEMVRSFGSQS